MGRKKSGDSLGDRMKVYEKCYNITLPKRVPVMIRLDGKAFHGLTSGMEKPFDQGFIDVMAETAKYLVKNIQGAVLGYVQSDEISILLRNDKTVDTDPWFGNKIQKICSVTASMATSYFNKKLGLNEMAQFDCRVWILPLDDVPNYFIWRQQDWNRNSLQMFSRGFFSHSKLEGKNQSDMHNMLHDIDQNWALLTPQLKNGTFVFPNGEVACKKCDWE